ncbi:Aim36p TDEL_0G02880 [Torulaspora delbrueckii]|uniref:Altered inheritance of mitochondria protein 36, mitochondrial n=1 Tax=Torulaspora delbrueckii TaxID=4950 RepID=G8ZXN8_TORDE|nr:hypothetical protein TDEL_0G02880 [Torulaspora delbrueckii]CCE93655.1 hypothetical protein TDEL_0G02880 [Torulaspora delbrueckii]
MLGVKAFARIRVLRASFFGLPKVGRRGVGSGIRWYASPAGYKKGEDAPGFKKIFLVALVGTLMFVQAANSLDKNKPKTSFSEEEFENVMNGLKRRVAMFPAGTLNVKFLPSSSESILKTIKAGPAAVIDPIEAVEHFRQQKDGIYEALLNDLKSKYGSDYTKKLPSGMLVMLIGKYMKEKCSMNDEVVIVNFPDTIKDAIKFENEVCTVSKVLVPKIDTDSEVCRYYETVHKVKPL